MLPDVISQGWFDGPFFGPVKKSLKHRRVSILKRLRSLVHSISCLRPRHCAAARQTDRQTVSSQRFFQTGFLNSVIRVHQFTFKPQRLCAVTRCSGIDHNPKQSFPRFFDEINVWKHFCCCRREIRFYFSSIQIKWLTRVGVLSRNLLRQILTPRDPLFPPTRCHWLFSSSRRRFQRPVKCADAGGFIAASSESAAAVSRVTHGLVDR